MLDVKQMRHLSFFVLHIRIINASSICGCGCEHNDKLRMLMVNICGCAANADAIQPITNRLDPHTLVLLINCHDWAVAGYHAGVFSRQRSVQPYSRSLHILLRPHHCLYTNNFCQVGLVPTQVPWKDLNEVFSSTTKHNCLLSEIMKSRSCV